MDERSSKVADGEEDVDVRSLKVESHAEPDQALTMRLIRKTCASVWATGSDSADALLATKVLRLDFQRIADIDNLEVFTQITDLYLQHNRIRQIQNLDFLTNLRFLALAHNRIQRIEGLRHLKQLEFLDLSHNRIESFRVGEIPDSIVVLNLAGNPCCDDEHYRLQLVLNLRNLRMLDKASVGHDERRMLQSVLGLPVDSSSEEEEEEEEDDDEDDEDDGDDGGTDVARSSAGAGGTGSAGIRDAAGRALADRGSFPTEPDAVMRMREELRQKAAKHKAELEALRKDLATSSLVQLDRTTTSRLERSREELERRRAEIVSQSRQRQSHDSEDFARRKPVAERRSADDL